LKGSIDCPDSLIKEGIVENAKKKDAQNEERKTKCICMNYGFRV
jgi:hypothetical protein